MANLFTVQDSRGDTVSDIEAGNPIEAARILVKRVENTENPSGPFILHLRVENAEGEIKEFSFRIDPPTPECVGSYEHEFITPHTEDGLLGVWGGSLGGVNTVSVCRHCGLLRDHESRAFISGGCGIPHPKTTYHPHEGDWSPLDPEGHPMSGDTAVCGEVVSLHPIWEAPTYPDWEGISQRDLVP